MMETPEGRKDFNERTGRNWYWERRRSELSEYMCGQGGGTIDPRYLEHRDCPLCGAPNIEVSPLWIKEGLFYVKCPFCGMVYIGPMLKQGILEKTYGDSDGMNAWLKVLKNQEDLDREKFEALLDHIDKHLPDGLEVPRLLDVGASYGFFCHIAYERGWEPTGLELSEEALALYMKRYSREFLLHKEKLEDYRLDCGVVGYFDVLTFWEVLEHIPNPNDALVEAYMALKEGGILGILVPNMDSRTARILHEKAKMFGANHLNYWNADTLTRQLEVAGFGVIESGTLIGDVNTWYNHLNFEDPYAGNLVHPDHEGVTKEVLAQGEGYKLWVVARKKEG